MVPAARSKFGAPIFEIERRFESKCNVLKKVLVTLFGFFVALRSDSVHGESCPPSLRPWACLRSISQTHATVRISDVGILLAQSMLTETNICSVQDFLIRNTVYNYCRNVRHFLCGAERVKRFVYVHLRLKELAQNKNVLRHQQPEKDKQYVDFALPWLEKFLRTPMSGTEGHHCWTTTAREHFTEMS